MRKNAHLLLFLFCFLFALMGCIPDKGAPGYQNLSQTDTPLTTLMISGTGIPKVSTMNPTEILAKSREPLLTYYRTFSGEKIPLTGGISPEVRTRLQHGQATYTVLGFSTDIDDAIYDGKLRKDLKGAGIVQKANISSNIIVVKVPATAIGTLDELNEKGILIYCGFYPPEGKISQSKNQMIHDRPNDMAEVTVLLLGKPDDQEKRLIVPLFETIEWPDNWPKSQPSFMGTIKNQNILILAQMPIVIEISDIYGGQSQ